MTVYTIGHSTRSAESFIQLLQGAGVRLVWDIRRFPGSRHFPQFGAAELERSLAAAGVGYEHHPELGGRRRASANAPASAWRNPSFRGYAEYMKTTEFQHGLASLIAAAKEVPTAIMCSEAVPWRCHRNLVSDALTARGVEVLHILDHRLSPHTRTPFAVVSGGSVSYPAEE